MSSPAQRPDDPLQALQRSEERLRLALEAGGSGAWDWDMTRDVAEVSPSYRQLFGLPPDTPVTYDVWLSCLHPDDRERCRAYGERFFAGSDTDWRLQFRVLTPHLGVRWHRAIGKVYRDTDGKPARFVGVSTDVTEEQRAVAALRESEERFRTMADGLPLMIWVHDASGAQQFVNRTFLEYFGVEDAEMKGSRWQLLMHPDDGPSYAREFMDCVAARRPFHAEVRVQNARGEWRTIESWARPRWSRDGEFLGMVGTSADVSERREMERALREADRRKDEFLAMLGHELRNPLAVISAAMDVMRLGLPPGSPLLATREAAERQARILIRLVDDLLDTARITTGKIRLRRARLSMQRVLQAATETSRPDLQSRRHQLRIEEPGEELEVEGDEVRLVQVVANMLNNAARYTPEGGRIVVTLEREGGDAVLRVRDNGVGIDRQRLEAVFGLFVQAEPVHGGGGLGLGLALVKHLVELHGGTVTAHSEGPGKGSEFIVRLPLAPAAPAAPGEIRERAADPAAPRRVLLVDDNRDASAALASVVGSLGHEVREAHDGASAIELVRLFRPHLVVMDVGLPDMDGFEVSRRIRAMPNGDEPAIVAASGYGEVPGAARAAGMDAYLVKPLEFDQIQSLLSKRAPADGRAR